MPKASPPASDIVSGASAKPSKSHGEEEIHHCNLDDCTFSHKCQSIVSRHKWSHLPKEKLPCCQGLKADGSQCKNPYYRIDVYKCHWWKCHQDQVLVAPVKLRFEKYWKEYCKERNVVNLMASPSLLGASTSLQPPPPIANPSSPPKESFPIDSDRDHRNGVVALEHNVGDD